MADRSQRRLDGLGTVATVAAQLVKALLLLLNGINASRASKDAVRKHPVARPWRQGPGPAAGRRADTTATGGGGQPCWRTHGLLCMYGLNNMHKHVHV